MLISQEEQIVWQYSLFDSVLHSVFFCHFKTADGMFGPYPTVFELSADCLLGLSKELLNHQTYLVA